MRNKRQFLAPLLLISVLIVWLAGGGVSDRQGDKKVEFLSIEELNGTSTLPTALALSTSGVLHVAYVSGEHTIRYLRLGTHDVELVGVAGNQQRAEITLSLALNQAQQPGIAYVDDRSGDLVYAERRNGRWTTEIVEAVGQVGHFASLAYDKHSQPHISYFDNSHNDVKYATRASDGWRIETIDATGEPGFHIPAGFTQLALAPDPSGTMRPHVAYLAYRYKPYDGELRYATRHAWGWQIETVDATKGAGGFPSLVLDENAKPWISYYRVGTWDYQNGELRLAHRDAQRWQIEVIDRHQNAGRYNSLALTPDGKPIIAYYAATRADLRLAWWDNRWHTHTLLTEGDVGAWVRLAVDRHRTAHLTYADVGARITRYATLQLPVFSPRGAKVSRANSP